MKTSQFDPEDMNPFNPLKIARTVQRLNKEANYATKSLLFQAFFTALSPESRKHVYATAGVITLDAIIGDISRADEFAIYEKMISITTPDTPDQTAEQTPQADKSGMMSIDESGFLVNGKAVYVTTPFGRTPKRPDVSTLSSGFKSEDVFVTKPKPYCKLVSCSDPDDKDKLTD